MEDRSIALIMASTLVCNTVRKVLKRKGLSYPVYELSTWRGLEKAKELAENGTRMIISHGLTYEMIRENVGIPTMALPFSGIEAAIAVKAALRHSKRIIHMGASRSLNQYLNKSLTLLGIEGAKIDFHRLSENRSSDEQTQQRIAEGYEVIIGGFPTVNYARSHGKIGIEFDVDEFVIEGTLSTAEELVQKLREEEAKHELINAILNSISDGIIAIDRDRRVFLANPAARHLLKIPAGTDDGTVLEALLRKNRIVNVMDGSVRRPPQSDATRVVLKEVPVIVGEQLQGSVVSMAKVEEIQELESKIRARIVQKGLVAKSTFDDIAGTGAAITKIKERAKVYARYDSTVLITGETGTGKELFAQSIHNESRRKKQPFVAVNCATLPENLMESELFGYVKGAFTGASKEGKAGLFESADKGTIFLDEISEIPISMQAKLLRVIQEREIIRIGSDTVVNVDVRIICSTNRDLLRQVRDGKFKEDLYYRLCVLEVVVPPLRERKEDIADIARVLVGRFNRLHGKNVTDIAPEVLRRLEAMPFPGNIRELGNILERMTILCEGRVMDMGVLARSGIPPSPGERKSATPEQGGGVSFREAQASTIIRALEQTGGNKAAAARLLGVDTSTLWRKMKSLGIR
ncbi:MAG: sigma 54-interacting transcriptional regulator [Deltaproteobacteria bacterium]|nr:sigma 54-interacting transcriptional regulator [Deltaproteobacteria bacterium]